MCLSQCCNNGTLSLSHTHTHTHTHTSTTVFGVDLTTLVKLEGTTIPSFVNEAINFIESDWLDTEGLYRVSGTTSKVLEIKDKVDEGES